MIVATAGHIDHGKTRLVGALTGIDTDRLPEEKARGISIDLGFAYWTSAQGALIGFVDVPGHERFVRNMLAGVCGIDFAMLIVAADDGVMPQTIEHVQILDLLGIRRGVAVMTKVDRVDAGRREEVRAQIAQLVATTTLRDIDTIEASAVTGEGVDRLKAALSAAAGTTQNRGMSGQHFRFAVDRAFSVEGSGTVVTGTVFSGECEVGARLRVSPGGEAVRVRALRLHRSEIEAVHAGQRCAMNLTGVAVADVARGDWIVAEALHHPTQRVDAQIVLLPSASGALTPHTQVHLHLGAGESLARIVPIDVKALAPGARALVQIVVEKPIVALHGDRFILRDSAASRTLGGGTVLDPFAAGTRRHKSKRVASLAALAAASTHDALAALLQDPSGVDLDHFEVMFNLVPDAAKSLYGALDTSVLGSAPRTGIPRARHASLTGDLEARLRDFHAREPAAPGMAVKALRSAVAPELAMPAFEAFLHDVAATKRIVVKGGMARLPEHDVAANPADRALWERLLPLLLAAGAAAPRAQELARDAGVDERSVRDLLFRRRAGGIVYRVGTDRFCLRTTLAALAATAQSLARTSPNGTFTAADFRDAIGVGRMLAIEILECLDGVGVTLRVGDARRLHRDPAPLLGASLPFARRRDQ